MNYKKLHEHILQEHDLFLLEDMMKEIVSVVLEMDDQKLFNHMYDEHDLLLLQSQKQEIVDIVLEMHNEKPETCTESIERQYKEKGNQLHQVYGAIKEPSNKSAVGSAKIADSVADSRKIEKMKTAMQQHIEWLEGIRNKLIKSGDYGGSLDITDYILNAQSLLEQEKKQMINAYKVACVDGVLFNEDTNVERAEQWYNETYGEKK